MGWERLLRKGFKRGRLIKPLVLCWWDCEMMWLLWKTVWQLLEKLEHWVTVCSHKSFYVNIHSSIIHSSPKVETTLYTNVLDPYNGILFDHKKKWSTDTSIQWMSLENITLNEQSQTQRDPDTKGHILYGFIYAKCPEQAQKWRVGSGC